MVLAAAGVSYVVLTGPSRPAGNRPPVAVLSASDLAPATYERVQFSASGSHDPDGDALTFVWSFQGVGGAAGVFANATFTSVGSFNITLTATDAHGTENRTAARVVTHPASLRVGTNTPFPPFEFYRSGGSLVGFDIDLVANLTKRLAYAPKWTDVPDYSFLLNDVAYGVFDMGASAIDSSGAVGAHNNLTLYLSDPYYAVVLGVLEKAHGSVTCPLSSCRPADLANTTIGVLMGSDAYTWVESHVVGPGLTAPGNVSTYSSDTQAIAALQGGSVQVVITEIYLAQSFATNSGGQFVVAGPIPTGETYSLAFPKTAAGLGLRDRINAALQGMISDGTYEAIVRSWFTP